MNNIKIQKDEPIPELAVATAASAYESRLDSAFSLNIPAKLDFELRNIRLYERVQNPASGIICSFTVNSISKTNNSSHFFYRIALKIMKELDFIFVL